MIYVRFNNNESATIEQVAQALGVSATAIAGFMAKERNSYDSDMEHALLNPVQDAFFMTQFFTHDEILSDYQRVINDGLVGTIPSGYDKLRYSTLNDVGYANIKLQTAIEVIASAPSSTIAALGLTSYANDYGLLLRDLAADNNGIAAKITGLIIQQADRFYVEHGAVGWDAMSEQYRDGLRVTFAVNGPERMQENYLKNIANPEHYGSYRPQLGDGESGGVWTKENSPRFTQIFGIDYATYSSGATSTGTFSETAAPANLSEALSRPSSSALIDYSNSYTAVLKKGGTLSDVVAIENAKGNNISVEDLRNINGLTPAMDNKLQIGQRIVVPTKVGNNLVVNFGDVQLSMNSVDGTYQYTTNNTYTNTTTVYTRTLDIGSGLYTDHYTETSNVNGAVLNTGTSAVDPAYGCQFNNGAATTNLFTCTITDPSTIGSTGATDPTTSVNADNSTLLGAGVYTVNGVGNVNTASGNTAYANNQIAGLRPGSYSLVDQILDSQFAQNTCLDPNLSLTDSIIGAAINTIGSGVLNTVPTDPLVLDLNGDGVKLTSFSDAPVLFDINHDGGSKELTGWVSAQDGIVVYDLNANGKIDDISETMSEYFNGAVGTGGNEGTKPYANGFAALKSLDSNSDNQFTDADTAWNNVKVWVDANHDGVTDAGELKTFSSLSITGINLTPTTQSGLVSGGNEILATGTFTMNGATQQAQAARFIANPTGNTTTVSATGSTVTAADGQSTYISAVTTGEAIDVATKGVKNAYGDTGSDTLTGDANANWLAGNGGSDTFNAGAGDDVLLIDAADQQANIHAGDGFDMVQVVGSEGVTFNLAQAGAEIAIGNTGNDIFIGGGRSSVFVRGGDGDDIVIGGGANDALSGENGNDLIDGGAGNDLIRGGRGQDQLLGGAGDDIIMGGQDDDRFSGGAGNDVLRGEQGDDVLDGGDQLTGGADFAEFTGSFADYRITKLDDATYRVVDTRAGRDGADILKNVEKLNFADVSAVDITLDNPLPVKDVITVADRVGLKLIKVSDLLANDRDWQGDALHITTISDLVGGTLVGTYNATTKEWTPTLTANGELQFTPDPNYTGVMSFKYKIADVDNTPGATAIIFGTTTQAEMRGQVFIKTPDMPTDSIFTDQWYLNDINILPVWKDYTGKGVNICISSNEPIWRITA